MIESQTGVASCVRGLPVELKVDVACLLVSPCAAVQPITVVVEFSTSHDVISDAQFGFQPGRGTVDSILSLHAIISKVLSSKKILYCAFIDFKKAFDYIDRKKFMV